jgi:hypothetical protein
MSSTPPLSSSIPDYSQFSPPEYVAAQRGIPPAPAEDDNSSTCALYNGRGRHRPRSLQYDIAPPALPTASTPSSTLISAETHTKNVINTALEAIDNGQTGQEIAAILMSNFSKHPQTQEKSPLVLFVGFNNMSKDQLINFVKGFDTSTQHPALSPATTTSAGEKEAQKRMTWSDSSLNLAGLGLTSLPAGLFDKKNLYVINLSGDNNIPKDQIALLKQSLPNCTVII